MSTEPKLNVHIDTGETLFSAIGGFATCLRLSERFHQLVATDEVLHPLFPKSSAALTQHFALFLAERFGGPPDYSKVRGKQSLVCRHAHLSISSDEEHRWLAHMATVLDDLEVSEGVRERLDQYFQRTAATLTDPLQPFYALELGELSTLLDRQPNLVEVTDHGHSLLKIATRRWDLARVQLLLEHDANPNGTDQMGHAALYHATNADVPLRIVDGRAVVELLLRYGADPKWASGPGRCTPLHMTARRGHVGLAEALLDAGAEIEARDSKGETSLRRAVNCGHSAVVELLLSRGANALSRDKMGRTPRDVARHQDIRQLLGLATS